LQQFDFPASDSKENNSNVSVMAPLAAASLAFMPMSAEAASGTNQIASAFVAYGHYLSLFVMVAALMFEKLTIEPGMSKEKETSLVAADATYGIAAVAVLVTGYYRLVEYGKGWYFYSHEPIFWIKMVFFVILGSASLFPTITSIKRFVAAKGDGWEPMSEKLANRMGAVINAELLMMASIPLSATLMSRGVGYTEAIPIEIIGPAFTGVTAAGLSFKYIKEALTWSEDELTSTSMID
jgi:putative membrane protein